MNNRESHQVNKKEQFVKHNHKGILGKLLIALCIGAPIAGMVLLLLNRLGVVTFGGGIIPYLLFLLCPLSHFLMIPFMGKKGDNVNSDSDNNRQTPSCH